MVAVVRPTFLEAVEGGLRALGAPVRRDRRGDRAPAQLRALHDGEVGRRDSGAPPHRRGAPLRGRAAPRRSPAAGRRPTPDALVELLASEQPQPGWIYEQYDHLVGSRTVRRPGLDAAVLRLRPSLRGLAVSLDGPAARLRATRRTARRRWPCWRRRGTSPAPAASRSRSPTASTSATRRSRRSPGSWPRRSRGWRRAAEALGIPVVSGNVSLYNETDGRAIPPTPVVGCVGLVPDVRARPGPLAGGRRRAARRRARSLACSEYQALTERGGSSGFDRGERSSSRSSGARADVSHDGGLRGRARRGGALERVGAELELPDGPPRRRRGRAGGVAVARTSAASVSAAARLGAVGGDRLLEPLRSCARSGASLDVRRLRHPRSRPRRRAARATSACTRSSTAARSRPGSPSRDGGRLTVLRDMGLVAQVFNEQKLGGLRGELAIGHTRYSTTGGAQWANAQPLVHHGRARTVALGHNGNLVNAGELRDGAAPPTASARLELRHRADRRADRRRRPRRSRTRSRARWTGSRAPTRWSRSPRAGWSRSATRTASGRSCLGAARRTTGWSPPRRARSTWSAPSSSGRSAAASSCSPTRDGAERAGRRARRPTAALCIFEFFYLARPDTRLAGVEVHGARVRMGERLAEEAPVEADLVLPIPDSGTPAAIGFSRATGHPVQRGADQEPLRRAHVHPARPGAARAGHQAQVQPARRGGRASGS